MIATCLLSAAVLMTTGPALPVTRSLPPAHTIQDADSGEPAKFFWQHSVRVDPTDELAAAFALSDAQQQFIRSQYADYIAAARDVGRRTQRRVEKAGVDWRADPRQIDPEVLLEWEKIRFDAMRDARREIVQLEQSLFDGISRVIADAQRADYERMSRLLRRRGWLNHLDAGLKWDFLQFADPVELALEHVEHLERYPDSLAQFEALTEGFEQEMVHRAPAWAAECSQTRHRRNIAMLTGDQEKIARATRAHHRTWVRMYAQLTSYINGISLVFEEAGQFEAARSIRESFWSAAFPELLVSEAAPTLYAHLAEHLDNPELLAAASELNRSFARQRHPILKRLTATHVSNFEQWTDGPFFVLDAFGASSPEIVELQLARCELAISYTQSLRELLGPEHAELVDDATTAARRKPRPMDYDLFDTQSTRDALKSMLVESSGAAP